MRAGGQPHNVKGVHVTLPGTATQYRIREATESELDGEMELRLLAVLPHARRSGIGWRLLAESANLA
jgi:ribosomal protein S18 acetylase RimI-like enzyme